MREHRKFYIDGAWVDPIEPRDHHVIDPSTETPCAVISLGTQADVDRAVKAARAAFDTYSRWSVAERAALLERVLEIYARRQSEIAEVIRLEMGAPQWLAAAAQAPAGLAHFRQTLAALRGFSFEESRGATRILREPVGVCALITPWNWPINQVACKVAPALAAGCTMVLKPSELAPLDAMILAEVLHEAGAPAGVFNLVNGDGPGVGAALAAHPGVDMVSFTGSVRGGVQVAQAAAPTVKRVHQELGGKSANLLLDDVDLEKAVTAGVRMCFHNSGQSCNAPTRMLVPRARHDEAAEIAAAVARSTAVADPREAPKGALGPLANAAQFARVQSMIERGASEGARLVAGGAGRPEGLAKGYYARPTVFAGARNDMVIAREEVFGPVLAILPYDTEDEAVAIANDSDYGLSGYVQSASLDRARDVARRLRTGNVHINGAGVDYAAPFGGYRRSGNGREWGEWGLAEYLEIKAVLGYEPRTR